MRKKYKLKDIDFLIILFAFIFMLAFMSYAPITVLMIIVLIFGLLALSCRVE